ncbi:MAG: hypothetical protein RIR00_1098 [Pseudomonadota bacterium]|jgi:peptidyl-prolyl cis-trans isomerase SurA
MSRLALIFLALCLPALAAAQASRSYSEPQEVDRIVAVVGNEVITMRELRTRLDTAVTQLRRQGTPLPPMDVLESQMLERMVMDKVQLQFASESGVRIDDAQVDLAIGRIAASNKMSLQQFRAELEKDGVAYARFREEIREEMTLSRLREREVDSRLSISDAEVDHYLENQAASSNEEYQVAHILLRAPESASPEQLQKLKAKADDLIQRARNGESFAQLAASASDAPDALQGGDLGWRTLDRMPGLFGEVLGSAKSGDVLGPLRSSNGYHIVKLVAKRGGAAVPAVEQTHARHILVRVDELVSEKEARRKLEALRERLVNGENFAELARLFSVDGSASKGGELGWLYPGDTVPDFERAMDALKPMEISPVVQSPFGFHLIQVLERRKQDVSQERQRQMAKQALRERKIDEAFQDWLRQLRDRAYVENRLVEK